MRKCMMLAIYLMDATACNTQWRLGVAGVQFTHGHVREKHKKSGSKQSEQQLQSTTSGKQRLAMCP